MQNRWQRWWSWTLLRLWILQFSPQALKLPISRVIPLSPWISFKPSDKRTSQTARPGFFHVPLVRCQLMEACSENFTHPWSSSDGFSTHNLYPATGIFFGLTSTIRIMRLEKREIPNNENNINFKHNDKLRTK